MNECSEDVCMDGIINGCIDEYREEYEKLEEGTNCCRLA